MPRRSHCLAALLCAPLFLLAGCPGPIDPGIVTADEDFELSTDPNDADTLDVRWLNGRVTIVLDETATAITATGAKFVTSNSLDDADAGLDDLVVALAPSTTDNKTILLTLTRPPSTVRAYRADVTVTIPVALDITLTSQNGAVELTDTDGAATITVNNGAVVVDNHTGDVTITAENGGVRVNARDGNVTVDTRTGGADITARPPAGGAIDVTVNIGSIDLRVPPGFAADLDLDAEIGNVHPDLVDFVVTNLQATSRTVTATLNGGGGGITAKTNIGSVDFTSIRP